MGAAQRPLLACPTFVPRTHPCGCEPVAAVAGKFRLAPAASAPSWGWTGHTLWSTAPLVKSHRGYALEGIRLRVHNCDVEVHRSRQFKRWVDGLVSRAKAGDAVALAMARHVLDELNYVRALEGEPEEDTATLKWVRQSGRYRVWRLSHPFDADMAVRIICWFDPEEVAVVVVLFGANKASMGDVFYDSVGSRADQAIDQWKFENQERRP